MSSFNCRIPRLPRRAREDFSCAELPNSSRLGHQLRVRAAPSPAEPGRGRRRARDLDFPARMRFGRGNGFVRVCAIWAGEFGDVFYSFGLTYPYGGIDVCT